MYGSPFKNKHFVLWHVEDLLKRSNTTKTSPISLNIILYYSSSLNTCESLIC